MLPRNLTDLNKWCRMLSIEDVDTREAAHRRSREGPDQASLGIARLRSIGRGLVNGSEFTSSICSSNSSSKITDHIISFSCMFIAQGNMLRSHAKTNTILCH